MNAREKISTALQASQFTAEQAAELSCELYDAVARELAKRIRSHPECEIGGYGDGILDASFMIEPEEAA